MSEEKKMNFLLNACRIRLIIVFERLENCNIRIVIEWLEMKINELLLLNNWRRRLMERKINLMFFF
jgi:hypothetical protein